MNMLAWPWRSLLIALPLLACGSARGESVEVLPATLVVYKTTPQAELHLEYFFPADHTPEAHAPAVLFFFGGGWMGGNRNHLKSQAQHLADRGIVGITADYRTKNGHGTTPFECVKDAVAAMRYARAHAPAYGIDPDRLGAGGGSAGGHLAMALATLTADWIDDQPPASDTLADISQRPDALVLFNPVYDNSPEGYGQNRLGDRWREFSPVHNLHAEMPPTLVLLGTKDKLIPVETAEKVRDEMTALGVRSDLILYPDQPHGFFNPRPESMEMHHATVQAMDDFLVSLGWLPPAAD